MYAIGSVIFGIPYNVVSAKIAELFESNSDLGEEYDPSDITSFGFEDVYHGSSNVPVDRKRI